MRLQVLRIFEDKNFTDREKLFLWLVTKFHKKYGYDWQFTMHAFDLKVILLDNVHAHITKETVPTNLTKYFRFAYYSEKHIGIELEKSYREPIIRNASRCSTIEVNIKDNKVKALYLYLQGALTHADNWANTTMSLTREQEKRLDRLDLYEVMNAQLD